VTDDEIREHFDDPRWSDHTREWHQYAARKVLDPAVLHTLVMYERACHRLYAVKEHHGRSIGNTVTGGIFVSLNYLRSEAATDGIVALKELAAMTMGVNMGVSRSSAMIALAKLRSLRFIEWSRCGPGQIVFSILPPEKWMIPWARGKLGDVI
jgi:hypothetical protein